MSEMEYDSKTKCNKVKQSQQVRDRQRQDVLVYWCDFCFLEVGFNQVIKKLSFMPN